jgi:hypothetical protein
VKAGRVEEPQARNASRSRHTQPTTRTDTNIDGY